MAIVFALMAMSLYRCMIDEMEAEDLAAERDAFQVRIERLRSSGVSPLRTRRSSLLPPFHPSILFNCCALLGARQRDDFSPPVGGLLLRSCSSPP